MEKTVILTAPIRYQSIEYPVGSELTIPYSDAVGMIADGYATEKPAGKPVKEPK